MDVVVTGCAGFIGARVCGMLLDRGDRVAGMDDMNGLSYDPALKEKRLEELRNREGFLFRKADISDAARTEEFFSGLEGSFSPSAVINLAAHAGVRLSAEMPLEFYRTNVLGTINLLEACRVGGIKKFVFISSSSVYGESGDGSSAEDSPTDKPLSPYAASKFAGEGICHSYHKIFGTDVTALRYFTVYGPAGRPDMSIFRFVRAVAEGEEIVVFGDGTQSRDFTFVDDAARATVLSLKETGFEAINIAGGASARLKDVIALIEGGLGKKAIIRNEPMHPADPLDTKANISKAEKVLGWKPQVGIEEGIKSCVDWYVENREWASRVKIPEV